MSRTASTCAVLDIELSPAEGAWLAAFLSDVIAEDQDTPSGRLQSLEDRLADANRIAVWLRANLSLECSLSELLDVQDALITKLAEEGWPQERLKALNRILGRLNEVRQRAVAEASQRSTHR